MFKEVAPSQSLHWTHLQKALRLRGLKLSQKEHLRQAPARWEDHAWATVMHCMSEKQLGTTAICYVAIHHATTDVCFVSPFKQLTQLVLIGAFDMFSLTAIPCRMHRISFDLRSEAAQGPVSTGVGDRPGSPQGACCQLLLAHFSLKFLGPDFLALLAWWLAEAGTLIIPTP
jgi:hypothetical protein